MKWTILAAALALAVTTCRADQLHTMMNQDVRQVLQNVPEARQADEAMQAYLSGLPSGARSVVAGLISAQAEAGYLSGLLDKNINDVLAGDRRLAEANGALRAYIGAQHGALHDRLMEVVSGEYAAYFAAGKIRSNPSLAGGGPQYVPIPVPDMPFVDPAPAIPTPSMPRPCFGFVDPGASYAGAICY
jgi:hypothetical protein